MTARAALTFAPRLLGEAQAAAYIGVSPSKLRTLDIPRKECGGRKLFDRFDLDAWANDLPYEGGAANGW
jgi:hypothetical protein